LHQTQFAFSQFLAWSDQPIYVLEKDNDLDITKLAVSIQISDQIRSDQSACPSTSRCFASS